MDDEVRSAREREVDARVRELDERLDRLFAFQGRPGRSPEERLRDLELHVMILRRLMVHVGIAASGSRLRALEKMERLVDEEAYAPA